MAELVDSLSGPHDGPLLAIDGGGTHTRCRVFDAQGRVHGEGIAGPSNHLLVGIERAREAVRAALAGARRTAGLPIDAPCVVSAALAGIDFDGLGATEARALFEGVAVRALALHGDIVAAHVGAFAGGAGVLALAGTGSAVIAIDANGRRAKAGGWGPVYGDEGSGYRLGQQVLAAAARAFDRTGPPTDLLFDVTGALGLPSFRDSVQRVYAEAGPATIARLAPLVTAAAERGDAVARAILTNEGDALASLVASAARQLELPPPVPLSWQGSVLRRSSLARAALVEALATRGLAFECREPSFDPIVGAFMFGCDSAGWPRPAAPQLHAALAAAGESRRV